MLEMLEVGHRVGVAQWGDQGTNQLPAAADPPGSETNQKRLDLFPEFLTSNTNVNKFMGLFSGFGFSKNNRPIEHTPPPPRGEQQKCRARDHQEENCSCNVWHGFFLVWHNVLPSQAMRPLQSRRRRNQTFGNVCVCV